MYIYIYICTCVYAFRYSGVHTKGGVVLEIPKSRPQESQQDLGEWLAMILHGARSFQNPLIPLDQGKDLKSCGGS